MSGDMCLYDHGESPFVMMLEPKPYVLPKLRKSPSGSQHGSSDGRLLRLIIIVIETCLEYNPETPDITQLPPHRSHPLLPTPVGHKITKPAMLPTPSVGYPGPLPGNFPILPMVAAPIQKKTATVPNGMISMTDHHQIISRVIDHFKKNQIEAGASASENSKPSVSKTRVHPYNVSTASNVSLNNKHLF